MSFEITDIDAEQRKRLLSMHEGQYLDFKGAEVKPAKMSRALSALANRYGGEVHIGISEDAKKAGGQRTWDGFPNPEAANAHLQVIEQCFPLGQHVACTFLESDGESGYVLKVEVEKTPNIVKATDEVAYVRYGAQNLPVDTREGLDRLEMNKGIRSHEDTTVGTPVETVSNSETVIEFMMSVVPTAEPEDWLRSQRVVRDDKPTVGGLLVFSDLPQSDLPKTAIKLYRYCSCDEEGSRDTLSGDPVVVEGNIVSQINNAVAATVEMVERTPALGEGGLEIVTYPKVALHEIITNAVLHRDYSIGRDIQVRVFDNRIEVDSPGVLPGHITVENILDEQLARNPRIVRMVYKFPDRPNKDVGEGLNTAFAAMHELNLKEPVIEERDSSVVVKIIHERLASPEETVLDYLRTNDTVNNSIGRKICHIGSENVMKRVFERLIKANQIERVPELRGRKAAYRLMDFDREGVHDDDSPMTLF